MLWILALVWTEEWMADILRDPGRGGAPGPAPKSTQPSQASLLSDLQRFNQKAPYSESASSRVFRTRCVSFFENFAARFPEKE